jgi:hypothetical protein
VSTREFAEESAVELAGSEGEICCHFFYVIFCCISFDIYFVGSDSAVKEMG